MINEKLFGFFPEEEPILVKINLRRFYPYYCEDYLIEVSKAVADELIKFRRIEENYLRLLRWHGAYYTVNIYEESIQRNQAFITVSPETAYIRKATVEQMYKALNSLPDKQRERIYAHYIWNLPKSRIAKLEGVNESAVRRSIERGIDKMRKIIFGNL